MHPVHIQRHQGRAEQAVLRQLGDDPGSPRPNFRARLAAGRVRDPRLKLGIRKDQGKEVQLRLLAAFVIRVVQLPEQLQGLWRRGEARVLGLGGGLGRGLGGRSGAILGHGNSAWGQSEADHERKQMLRLHVKSLFPAAIRG